MTACLVPSGLHHCAATLDKQDMPMVAHRVNPTDKHVGARLRVRRLMLDVTQEEIAKALGLTFQQVQKYRRA